MLYFNSQTQKPKVSFLHQLLLLKFNYSLFSSSYVHCFEFQHLVLSYEERLLFRSRHPTQGLLINVLKWAIFVLFNVVKVFYKPQSRSIISQIQLKTELIGESDILQPEINFVFRIESHIEDLQDGQDSKVITSHIDVSESTIESSVVEMLSNDEGEEDQQSRQ